VFDCPPQIKGIRWPPPQLITAAAASAAADAFDLSVTLRHGCS